MSADTEALAVRDADLVDEMLAESHGGGLIVAESHDLQQSDPYYGGADLDLTETEIATLLDPIPDEIIEVLPDGSIYLPQVEYRRILNKAFKPGGWCLRPVDPQYARIGKTVSRSFALYVHGKFAAEAIGEHDYIESNAKTSWATACEAAKSNALMRCCKDLGIALQCWQKSYGTAWKAKHATSQWQKNKYTGKDELVWSRRGIGKHPAEPAPEPPPEPKPFPSKSEAYRAVVHVHGGNVDIKAAPYSYADEGPAEDPTKPPAASRTTIKEGEYLVASVTDRTDRNNKAYAILELVGAPRLATWDTKMIAVAKEALTARTYVTATWETKNGFTNATSIAHAGE